MGAAARRSREPRWNRLLVRHGSIRRHPLRGFFVLAYLFSWGYWIPVALAGGHWSHFPGLTGPMLSALVVTALTQGTSGLHELLARATRWRIPVRLYLACALPAGVAAATIASAAAVGVEAPSLDELSTMPGLPTLGWFGVLALVVVINGYGEETGWRGQAWPALRQRHTLAGAALLLAVPWAIWHLPTFWIDSGMRGFPLVMIPGFLVGLAAGAVVLGRLFEQARQSLVAVALWHGVLNMASATKGTEGVAAAAVTTVVIIWAIRILRAKHQSRPPTRPADRWGSWQSAPPTTTTTLTWDLDRPGSTEAARGIEPL